MPTHLFKKARKNTRYVRRFEYTNIKDTLEKHVATKLKPRTKWLNAMDKFPPSALLAKVPSHVIEIGHPSSNFPYAIKYPSPSGKHKRDIMKKKMIPPQLEFQEGLDFKLACDFPFELSKPKFLYNTEEELKKDDSLYSKFFELKKSKSSMSEIYEEISNLFKSKQLEECANLYSVFEKMDISEKGGRAVQKLESSIEGKIVNDLEPKLSNDDKLKIKMLILMKTKHEKLQAMKLAASNSVETEFKNPYLDLKDTKPVSSVLLEKQYYRRSLAPQRTSITGRLF
eukprot:NODE_226_length_12301_cov_1.446648.p6 type:complete len:284 gc:universal NODE_226_length_12301_cov_1.446648:6537-7388(+)